MLSHFFASAQQSMQFSQYYNNQLIINPAYAGADDALSLTLLHRNQWTGVQGTPKTTTLSGHTLFKNAHTGLGFSLYYDEINIHSNASFNGIYSYRMSIGPKSYLSFGLQAGVHFARSDYASLSGGVFDPDDPVSFENLSETAFQVGTGIFFSSPKLEVGLSAPILYTSGISYIAESENISPGNTHFFLLTRYKIQVSPSFSINPGFLVKMKSDWPVSFDLNVDTWIKDVLMFALSYRSGETLSTILQMKVLPQMRIGYAYDIPLSNSQHRYFNSHELMLNYIFNYKNYNVKSPR